MLYVCCLFRLRQVRMSQLKLAYEEKQTLLAKGHGEYREIAQDEFLKEVTSSPRVAVHFYHNDFERCKIMDMVSFANNYYLLHDICC